MGQTGDVAALCRVCRRHVATADHCRHRRPPRRRRPAPPTGHHRQLRRPPGPGAATAGQHRRDSIRRVRRRHRPRNEYAAVARRPLQRRRPRRRTAAHRRTRPRLDHPGATGRHREPIDRVRGLRQRLHPGLADGRGSAHQLRRGRVRPEHPEDRHLHRGLPHPQRAAQRHRAATVPGYGHRLQQPRRQPVAPHHRRRGQHLRRGRGADRRDARDGHGQQLHGHPLRRPGRAQPSQHLYHPGQPAHRHQHQPRHDHADHGRGHRRYSGNALLLRPRRGRLAGRLPRRDHPGRVSGHR